MLSGTFSWGANTLRISSVRKVFGSSIQVFEIRFWKVVFDISRKFLLKIELKTKHWALLLFGALTENHWKKNTFFYLKLVWPPHRKRWLLPWDSFTQPIMLITTYFNSTINPKSGNLETVSTSLFLTII